MAQLKYYDPVSQTWKFAVIGASGIVNVSSPLVNSGTASAAQLSVNVGSTGGVQAWDADLDAISAITGTLGLLKKTGANTWTLDTTSYAPLASPTFTGNVTVPTPSASTDAVTKAYVDVVAAGLETLPLDDLKPKFTGSIKTFNLTFQGENIPVYNPFRLSISINGILQRVVLPTEYVWQSPLIQSGFYVNSNGQVVFNKTPLRGSANEVRLLPGSATTSRTIKKYPFTATDILLGG